jgi:crotonobetainyl-CoA:carnitine CoA-transferase CaiB-like acyl-CoA transferase
MRELPLLDRKILIETQHPSFGTVRQIASPISFPGVSRRHRRAPRLGEHTDDILRRYLGYNKATIGELRQRKIV